MANRGALMPLGWQENLQGCRRNFSIESNHVFCRGGQARMIPEGMTMIRAAASFPSPISARSCLQVLVVGSVGLLAPAATAHEPNIEPEAPPVHAAPSSSEIAFDVAVGVAFTNDYVSRGITNSNSEPAIQGYIEPAVEIPTLGTVYVNVWSSNVDYGEGFEGAEIDVAGGIRHEFGPLSVDL